MAVLQYLKEWNSYLNDNKKIRIIENIYSLIQKGWNDYFVSYVFLQWIIEIYFVYQQPLVIH